MEQGPIEETMIRRARADKRPAPDKIQNAPQLTVGNGFYFQTFLILSSCRPVGMGEGRIPWLAAYAFAREAGLSPEEFEDTWVILSNMDAAYMKFRSDQAEKKRASA